MRMWGCFFLGFFLVELGSFLVELGSFEATRDSPSSLCMSVHRSKFKNLIIHGECGTYLTARKAYIGYQISKTNKLENM